MTGTDGPGDEAETGPDDPVTDGGEIDRDSDVGGTSRGPDAGETGRGPDTGRSDASPRSSRRRLLLGLGAAVGALGVGGVAWWRATAEDREVTVGGSLPLSGPLEPIGEPLRRGLRLHVERTNDEAGPLDPSLDLRLVDDGGDPSAAADAYRSLVDEVDLLVAPYGSDATGAVMDVVEAAGVPCVAPTAGDRRLWTDGRAWTTQMLNPVDTFLHPALATAREGGARSVGFVYRDDGFTPDTMEGAIRRARRREWVVRAAAVYDDEGGMGRALDRVLAEDPDLLVGGGFRPGAAGGGFLPDALALARAHDRADRSAEVACWSIGASFLAFADRLGDLADGALGVTGWKPYVAYPGNEAFVERHADRWDARPDSHAAQGYAAGQVLAAALDRAVGPDPAGVRDALFALETETVFGRYRVDERGLQTGKANAVVQWQDGRPVVVWPERWRSGDIATARHSPTR